jgi:predicted helicase
VYDPYVKAIRFATDRIGDAGVVCYITNRSFLQENSLDGLRKHLEKDFDIILVLDLGGNIRKGQSGAGNVFGIRIGVAISVFVKLPPSTHARKRKATIYYHALPDGWNRQQKFDFLEAKDHVGSLTWKTLKPDSAGDWFPSKSRTEFREFMPLQRPGRRKGIGADTLFRTYSPGVSTNRDSVVYDFDPTRLARRVREFTDNYNSEVYRWQRTARPPKKPERLAKYIDDFVDYERVKWSETLKRHMVEGVDAKFSRTLIIPALYRPFTAAKLYYGYPFVDRPGAFNEFFPQPVAAENRVLCVTGPGSEKPFLVMMANKPVDLHFAGFGCGTVCFPFYTYSSDGSHRRENISRYALDQFVIHYDDESITREDVFHYVYALLHHQEYRVRYAEDLKRTLPGVALIGTSDVFRTFVDAGRELAELHVNYERQTESALRRVENKETKLDWRVERMKFARDGVSLIYNEHFTLDGVPPEALNYQLGSRSALEWVIDQYRVSSDEADNITSDPNRAAYEVRPRKACRDAF